MTDNPQVPVSNKSNYIVINPETRVILLEMNTSGAKSAIDLKNGYNTQYNKGRAVRTDLALYVRVAE